VQYF